MTPKEKAQELVDKFYQTTPNEAWYNPPLGSLSMEYKAWGQAKECALMAVDEILNSGIHVEFYFDNSVGYMLSYDEYYEEVKQEIEKL